MTPFRFSEEASLYAENFEVVAAMQERFQASIAELFDLVIAELGRRPLPAPLQHFRSANSVNLYLGDRGERGAIREPQLWFRPNDPGIIRDEGVIFFVTRVECTDDERRRVAALSSHPSVRDWHHPASATKYSFFELWISWSGGNDPVQTLAGALGNVLPALHAVR